MSPREIAVFAPLVVLTLWMGIYPSSFTTFFDATTGAMVQNEQAMLAVHATKLAGIVHPMNWAAATARKSSWPLPASPF